jgi:hypothetical protein
MNNETRIVSEAEGVFGYVYKNEELVYKTPPCPDQEICMRAIAIWTSTTSDMSVSIRRPKKSALVPAMIQGTAPQTGARRGCRRC